jgi:hypothetical protein
MSVPSAGSPAPPWRDVLAGAVGRGDLSDAELAALAAVPADAIDAALRDFASAHGPAALPALTTLASERAGRDVRRAARRALYRLAQRGVTAAPRPAPRPVVERQAERATRAWLSGIDGSGSRAVWIVFEGGFGGLALCSLILNDTVGIVEVAGGDISKRRLETELAALRASQKLPWVEADPARAVGLVAEALALQRAAGTAPPSAFARWQRLFEVAPAPPPPVPASADPALLDRSAELLELPEMAGWFLEPEHVQSDALDLLQARESRLVVSDQIKAERADAIVDRVVARELTPEARRLWARRLAEMAWIFTATDRPDAAALAGAAAVALADEDRDVTRHPFARALARRALEVAAEVSAGRLHAADVSRKPPGPGERAVPDRPPA